MAVILQRKEIVIHIFANFCQVLVIFTSTVSVPTRDHVESPACYIVSVNKLKYIILLKTCLTLLISRSAVKGIQIEGDSTEVEQEHFRWVSLGSLSPIL
jgi:hypothetical protein